MSPTGSTPGTTMRPRKHKGFMGQVVPVPPGTTRLVEPVPYQSHPLVGWDCGTTTVLWNETPTPTQEDPK